MLIPPGLADNLDAVAMLREMIDECTDAAGTWKNLAPLFVAKVGGDEGGACSPGAANQTDQRS